MNIGLGGSIIAMICVGLFALGGGGVGIWLILRYIQTKKKAKQSETWPSVEGKILSHDIRINSGDEYTSTAYLPQVTYTYHVQGQEFTGSKISYGSAPAFKSIYKAEKFLEQYPVGSRVTVYHDPEKPQDSVLEQAMRKMTAILVVGIFMIVITLCGTCLISFGVINMFMGR